jgi:hypothetical protein
VTQSNVTGVMQSDDIADEINGYFEKFGVNWHDEHLPQITKEARNLNEL